MKQHEIYVMTDIETNGKCPGLFSMLSLASVAVDGETGRDLGRFSANLAKLPGAGVDPDTMTWWLGHPEAYAASTANPLRPGDVMEDYHAWVTALAQAGRPVFTGYNVAFDYAFVNYYLHRFVGRDPFERGALDMKTLAMVLLPRFFVDSAKARWPREWFPPEGIHAHTALADAEEQAHELRQMLKLGGPR